MLYPREIEEVLIADPAVQDTVVIGRPSPVLGQVPVAYVIPALAPDTAGRLQDLPRAATGKIQRHRVGLSG
ncbi:MAG TPA: hypothetical protein VGD68_15930 [Streptosporangiaceae bacterium]